jgi:nucleotide-binding universal stress UspA family protein
MEHTMNNPDTAGHRPFIIVLGLDLTDSKSSGFALDQAARIASRIEPSQVHAVYALPEDASEAVVREATGLTQMYVNGKVAALAIKGPVLGVHVRRGDAAREIAQVAAELDADMIIVGTHKAPHLKTLFVGSTAERVMANARCPVLVAGPRPPPEASHVIVIEPPCPDCVRRRSETGNREFWCEQHTATKFLRRHVYSYSSETPFGSADMSVGAGGDST